jgi:ABC-type hemin transport system ATPase subunit
MSDIVIELRGWPGSPERALHTMMKAAAEIVTLRVENDHLKQARSDALAGGDALRDEIARYRAGLQKIVQGDGFWDAPSLARDLLEGKDAT